MKIIPYHELPGIALGDWNQKVQAFHMLCKKVAEESSSLEWTVRLVDYYPDPLNHRFFLFYDYADSK